MKYDNIYPFINSKGEIREYFVIGQSPYWTIANTPEPIGSAYASAESDCCMSVNAVTYELQKRIFTILGTGKATLFFYIEKDQPSKERFITNILDKYAPYLFTYATRST